MLCHEFKCIYIHIPKTAGESIHHVFTKQLGRIYWNTHSSQLLVVGNDDPAKGPPYLAHLRAADYVKCGHISRERFDAYFKFSFVRNPWDRIVSEYRFRDYPRQIDFKTYLFKHLPEPAWTDRFDHIVPQYDYLFDDGGNLLVDFVGKFENAKGDFEKICTRIGLPPTTLPHINKSPQIFRIPRNLRHIKRIGLNLVSIKRIKNTFQHYTEYYDDESRDFVTRLYAKDIEAFGYEFGS